MNLVDFASIPERKLAEGVMAHVVNTATMTVTHVRFVKGAAVPQHSHFHEQITNVIEGQLELTVNGETTILTKGKALVLPPNVPHSARALTDVYVIDVFHPAREDFR
jgi:quercetin dioxygenase-like cupin family protein